MTDIFTENAKIARAIDEDAVIDMDKHTDRAFRVDAHHDSLFRAKRKT